MNALLNFASEQPLWTTFILIMSVKLTHYLLNRFGTNNGFGGINPNQQRRIFRSLIGDGFLLTVFIHGLSLLHPQNDIFMGIVIVLMVMFVSYDWNRAMARDGIPMKIELPGIRSRFGSKRSFAYFSTADTIAYLVLFGAWLVDRFYTTASP